MKATVDLIKAGIAEAEKELTEIDKKRDAVIRRIKEMRHDITLLSGSAPALETAAAAPRPKGPGKDRGEQVGMAKSDIYGNVPIYKKVRTAVLSTITSKIPSGEWFRANIIRPVVAPFYPGDPDKYSRVYLMFLEGLKFVEHNKVKGMGSKYRWFPRFQDKEMTVEEVKKRIEEDRKALQDVLG